MPLYVEGGDRDAGVPPREDGAPDPFASPTGGDVAAAAFRQQNPIASVIDAINSSSPDRTVDPTWNPLEAIRGTAYERDHLQDFLGDQNESQTRARMAKIDAEEADRQTLAASGWAGTVASVGAGMLDPTMYLPIAGEAAKGLGVARTALGTAARMAATGAASTAASEALLQSSQQTRPLSESVGAIASGTLLMGVLGAGAGAMLSRGEIKAAAADLDRVRASDFSAAPADVAADANAAVGLPAAAGAASTDVRQLKLKNYGVPDWLKNTPYAGPAAEAVGDVLNRLSPTLRVFSSDSLVAKRAMADMAETPLVFEDNSKGIPTSLGAPPIDRLVRAQSDQIKMGANAALEDAFVDYRYGSTPPKFAMQTAALADARGQSALMNFRQFKEQVSAALYNGDRHPIAQVQRAAVNLRRDVFDKVGRVAQETLGPDGKPMLAEELAPPKGDQSYLPRVWNKETIAERRNEVHGVFTDWLARDQDTKAAAQERLADLKRQYDALDGAPEESPVLSQIKDAYDSILSKRSNKKYTAVDVADVLKSSGVSTSDFHALFSGNNLPETATGERVKLLSSTYSKGRKPIEIEGHSYYGLSFEQRGAIIYRGKSYSGDTHLAAVQAAAKDTGVSIDRVWDEVTPEGGAPARSPARQSGDVEARRLDLRAQIEDELNRWEGKSAGEAKTALKARAEAEAAPGFRGKPLKSADAAVDSAVKSILGSNRNLSRQELGGISDEIIDRLLGSPDGRLAYDARPAVGPPAFGGPAQQLRGSLLSRDFAIPTALVKDFVEKDTAHLVSAYVRSVLPDVMLTQRFGDVEMRDVFRKLNEEYAGRAKALSSEKDLRALEGERQGMIRDLAATRDRIRGVYGWSPDPRMRNAARIAGVARNWNVLADLGTSVANRLGDAGANAVFRHGFMNVMHDSWRPMLKAMLGQPQLAQAYRAQAKAMAVGVDSMLGHMAHDFGDVVDGYRPGSKFERGLAWAADRSMLVNMHGPWTDWTKTMASGVASAEVLRASERVAKGAASGKDVERLAAASIDRATAVKIHEAYSNGGGAEIDGVPVPNTRDWTDREARTAFEAAIGREANIAVITPGLEKPLWMSSPIAGLVGQFKSFVAGAYERLLIANLQQRDARTLQGAFTAVATGMLSYRLYTWLSGQQASDNPADWIKEGVHRSAILSWLSEGNEMQAKLTGGASDMYKLIGASSPLTRHDKSELSELLGPTYARLEGLTGALGDATRAVLPGDKPHAVWTAQDTHKIREVFFFQNLFAIRRLLDEAESGINSALGAPQRDRSGKNWQR